MTSALVHDLQAIINLSHTKTWEIFDNFKQSAANFGLTAPQKWRTPGEPAFVSTLLENAVNSGALRETVLKHLNPLGLCSSDPLISGIFIHQKPKVELAHSKEQIELGDLLLVRHHFKTGADLPEGRAILLQAKTARRPITGGLKNKDATQFSLYADWSEKFRFPHHEVGSPPDGSLYWDFSKGPGSKAASGEYGLVSNTRTSYPDFPEPSAWAVGAAIQPADKLQAPRVTGSTSFGQAFADFLLGRWGRPWSSQYDCDDHWSSFVKECLAAAVGWRHYPIDRLGSYYPRRRDLVSLCYALADAGADNARAWESSPVMPHWFRQLGSHRDKWEAQRDHERYQLVRQLLNNAGVDYRDLTLDGLPSDIWHFGSGSTAWAGPQSARGGSVLYIATSGGVSLEEALFKARG